MQHAEKKDRCENCLATEQRLAIAQQQVTILREQVEMFKNRFALSMKQLRETDPVRL